MKEEVVMLTQLGDALERSASADLAKGRRAFRSRRLTIAVAILAIVVPGGALAVSKLAFTSEQVAASMPSGTFALIGTQPRCTVVTQNVEYHCLLTRPPAPEVSDWKGTVEPTVDESKHVNGGCRSLESDGLTWECYIGKAAVDQQIIDESFLGQYAPSPGHG
jgi:hypothetical protein